MMRKIIGLILITVISLGEVGQGGQQADSQKRPHISEISVTLDLLFSHVLVYQKEGSPISGLLVDLESASLVLRIGGKDKKIPMERMAKVVIEKEKISSWYGIYGMALGAYLGSLIMLRAQPTAYMKSLSEDWERTAGVLVAAVAGGGLGYLARPLFEKDKIIFDFSSSDEKNQAEWSRLRRFLVGRAVPGKVHFVIQVAKVFTGETNRNQDLLFDQGFSAYAYGTSDINLLRKLQLDISISPKIDAGVALFFLGEPWLGMEKYTGSGTWNMQQTLTMTGYYAVGSYKPLSGRLSDNLNLKIGMGIGAAQLHFSMNSDYSWGFYPNYYSSSSEKNISKLLLSGVFFAELNLQLGSHMSLGLGADYVLVPAKQEIPAFPDLGLPAQTLRFNNANIGFTLGLHF